ncbi:BPG-independent [Mycena capillaripes]|nr:BPG-independent [Mycena capillaripes]
MARHRQHRRRDQENSTRTRPSSSARKTATGVCFSCVSSDGGVHSQHAPLHAPRDRKEQRVPETYIHFFGNGRDTAPCSAASYCQDLLDFMNKEEYGELGMVVGRYYGW